MSSSYELMREADAQRERWMDAVDPETGEIDEDVYQSLVDADEALGVEIGAKAVRIHHVLLSFGSTRQRLSKENERTKAAIKRIDAATERLESHLFVLVSQCPDDRVDMPTGGYLRNTTRTTKGYEIIDPRFLPPECLKKVADRTAIGEYKSQHGKLPPGTKETTKISQTTRRR